MRVKSFLKQNLILITMTLQPNQQLCQVFLYTELIFITKQKKVCNRYLKTYPGDKNVVYAHYLLAIIYFEQISDEKKDIKPLLDAKKKLIIFKKISSNRLRN